MLVMTEVKLTVTVRSDANGAVLSTHDFTSPEDALQASKWTSGGLRQIAQALLNEAVRREAFTSLLVQMTADPEYAQRYQVADSTKRAEMEQQLSEKVQHILNKNAQRLTLTSVQEAFQIILTQLPEKG
jgi:hypothetical protein